MAERKKRTFEVPTWYDEQPETQPPPEETWVLETDPVNFGRIETQVEGQQIQAVREAPQPTRAQNEVKPAWEIDNISVVKAASLKVKATDAASGRRVEYVLEPYFDNYRYARAEIAGVGRKLIKVFASKGIEVTEKQTPRPDLLEEMYQLLSIMMSDEACEKYEQPWSTIKTQFDSLL